MPSIPTKLVLPTKAPTLNTQHRQTAHQRGYTGKWRKARQGYLTSHPWCSVCLASGMHEPATEVDHIKPHKGNNALFWDHDNWQPLCHACHSAKTAREDGGFGNHRRPPPTQ